MFKNCLFSFFNIKKKSALLPKIGGQLIGNRFNAVIF